MFSDHPPRLHLPQDSTLKNEGIIRLSPEMLCHSVLSLGPLGAVGLDTPAPDGECHCFAAGQSQIEG